MKTRLHWAAATAFVLSSTTAHALKVTQFTPQGEAPQVDAIVMQFDMNAVRAGHAEASAPVALQCNQPAATKGQGRWNGPKEWVFRFDKPLPAGVECTATVAADWRPISGAGLPAGQRWQFRTGGPAVRDGRPFSWEPIEEEQVFLLRLTGSAMHESVKAHAWCSMDGVGERIPVRLVEGAERDAVLNIHHITKQAQAAPLSFQTLACQRPLTPGVRMELVWGAGIAGPEGISTRNDHRMPFDVRAPFTAEMQCERENAQAGCLPIRPVRVSLTASVTRAMADGMRLQVGSKTLRPQWDESLPGDALVNEVQFGVPAQEGAAMVLSLPKDFQDASGRPLSNVSQFPLKATTGSLPSLAKFAASPFGVIERYAESSDPQQPALLPVTLRKVEGDLQAKVLQSGVAGSAAAAAPATGSSAQMRTLQPRSDADIIQWYLRVQKYQYGTVSRKQAQSDGVRQLPRPIEGEDREEVAARMVSLLDSQAQSRNVPLPVAKGQEARPFEVVGIPLSSGFHVVELRSALLGQSLLDEAHGNQRSMVVRTSALVTNLSVHFKLGRENAMAWVTSLDRGQPVAGAKVQVSNCRGEALVDGVTDAQGRVMLQGLSPEPPYCPQRGGEGYFVSARVAGADGQEDVTFVWSDWMRGIEPWRFQVPVGGGVSPEVVAHTVLDRPLVRAGESVSMKHLLRLQTGKGLALPNQTPLRMVITHTGSGQEFTQPLSWRKTPTGGLSAFSRFEVPASAKLGEYRIRLSDGKSLEEESGSFRVEEFRLPVLQGRIAPDTDNGLVAVQAMAAQVQMEYVAGGPAAQLPVRVSALVRPQTPTYAAYDDYSFQPPRDRAQEDSNNAPWSDGDSDSESQQRGQDRIVADRLPLTLDRQGAGRVQVGPLPTSASPQSLILEATYADPNGEIQTLRSTQTLWPSAIVAGVQAEDWVSASRKAQFKALALNHQGKPQAGVPLQVRAVAYTTTTARKRMVGGFYSYDSHTSSKDLGTVCSGNSDARGMLLCDTKLDEPGEVELVVTAKDAQGHVAQAATSVWVTRQGEIWFGGENHDRMDVLPEQRDYQPGDTARLQVRMPFRSATALVALEREGILHTEVVQLQGQNPTVELKIRPEWGPNVFVSVLALRGRLREVPWYSFFTWGFKAPRDWWNAFVHEGRDYVAPTALVDLSKPGFRLGVAELRIGTEGSRIQVQLATDRESYPVRGKAVVNIAAKFPDGSPAAGAEVSIAAVDRALLELMPNTSWNVLEAMMQRRSWSVQTSTAQMEIVGRRHYGRKAVPAGGGGGHSATRELLDTLLLWRPVVTLDAQGRASVEVPLNDALTTFEVVAVADARTNLFGTGRAALRVSQDLQLVSGLPPLVREGDRFVAQMTARNTTQRSMRVEVTPQLRGAKLEVLPQTVELAAGAAQTLQWQVQLPQPQAGEVIEQLEWALQARELQPPQGVTAAQDALRHTQRVLPAVPLSVQQAGLQQIHESLELPVERPADAVAGSGGVSVRLTASLADGLEGVQSWWRQYPYQCLEQQTSKAIGLRDAAQWQRLMGQLPTYQDSDGLLHYFPPRSGSAQGGSDVLTAHLLLATSTAKAVQPAFALPDEARTRMLDGLLGFVEGRIQREVWSPRRDLDERKLAAIAALARHGRASPRLLESLSIAPEQWGVHALTDWLDILQHLPQVSNHAARLEEAQQLLRSRMAYQGSRIEMTDGEEGWWLMRNGDVAAARLLSLVVDQPQWQDDAPRLLQGLLGRQQGGAWSTTTANLWGGLAVAQFAKRFERAPVAGQTQVGLGDVAATVRWNAAVAAPVASPLRPKSGEGVPTPGRNPESAAAMAGAPWAGGGTRILPWPTSGQGHLRVQHQGQGAPWMSWQAWVAQPLKEPVSAGYTLRKTITPVEQAKPGQNSRGDIWRVRLEVQATTAMNWVAVTDPIPAGASILGSGLGRDSEMATQGERNGGAGWLAFEERSHEGYRAYYEVLPRGSAMLEYTVRLNNEGQFHLPPSRVEALYAPEMMGMWPNAPVIIEAAP